MASDLTYYEKEVLTCPCCQKQFRREQLRKGGGRLTMKEVRLDFHQIYTPTEKYGDVYPLLYSVLVCPQCYYASYKTEFGKLKDSEKSAIAAKEPERKELVDLLFSGLDFINPRRLQEGVSSYLLAISTYSCLGLDKSPTIRMGISALRAGWLMEDLHAKFPADNWDYLAQLLYRKAGFFYRRAIEMEAAMKERVSETPGLGPDFEQRFGFDGVLYLYAYLEYHYGPDNDPKVRFAQMEKAKQYVGRIFGMGRHSKEKPQMLLDRAHDLYDEISKWCKQHGGE